MRLKFSWTTLDTKLQDGSQNVSHRNDVPSNTIFLKINKGSESEQLKCRVLKRLRHTMNDAASVVAMYNKEKTLKQF